MNLADPNLTITSSSFGKITRARAADFGGNRTGEVSARIEFQAATERKSPRAHYCNE